MSQNLQNVVKFQKNQLKNLVDFEKCCKTHIFLQKSAFLQPIMSPPKKNAKIARCCLIVDMDSARSDTSAAGARRRAASFFLAPGFLDGRDAPAEHPGARADDACDARGIGCVSTRSPGCSFFGHPGFGTSVPDCVEATFCK